MINRAASISKCGKYRYALWRQWLLPDARAEEFVTTCLFIMLNPSTADGELDDPTIRRCIGFARSWRHAALMVVNLFALRTPHPRVMMANGSLAIGEHNNVEIVGAANSASQIVAAWGIHGGHLGRDREVMRLLAGKPIQCLGVTKAGHPRHPLYVSGDFVPVAFEMKETP